MNLLEGETVFLGKPIFSPTLIPILHRSTPRCIQEPFMVNGTAYHVTCLAFSQPYGVVFTESLSDELVEKVGPLLAKHTLFPKGATIVFAQKTGENSLRIRIWDKQAGEILYSLEGAAAACVGGILVHLLHGTKGEVIMKEQAVLIVWNRETQEVEGIVPTIE